MLKLIPSDDETLYMVAKEVPGEEVKACEQLIGQMVVCMAENGGCGLAAPQVGISKRVIVFMHQGQPRAMVNPVIRKTSGDTKAKKEGCLSFPGQEVRVRRKERIAVTFSGTDGLRITTTYSGKSARIIQHEIDHLDGKTIA